MPTWHWDGGTWQISLWFPEETPLWPMETSKLHFCGYRTNIQHLLWHFDLFSFFVSHFPKDFTLCGVQIHCNSILLFLFIFLFINLFLTLKNSPRDVFSEIPSTTARAQMTRQSSTYEGWWSPEAPKVLL